MREKNENDEKNFLGEEDEDILSFMQGYSGDEKEHNGSTGDDTSDYENDQDMDETDDDLLALLDLISAQEEKETTSDSRANNPGGQNDSGSPLVQEETITEKEPVLPENMPQESFSFNDDLMAINDLLGEDAIDLNEDFSLKEEKTSTPNDMGGIFSDVLSAVDSLNDKPNNSLNDALKAETANVEAAEGTKEEKKAKKKSIWQRIFGRADKNDVKDGNEKKAEKLAEAANKKAEKQAKKEAKKKETESKKAEKKKAGKAAQPKSKKAKSNNGEENGAADKKKAAKNKKDAKKKASVKKEKKVKQKEITAQNQVVDPDDNIKLNKLAVVFVMTFFILLGGIIIIGTDLYSYSLSIENASTAFSRQRYTEAYDDIYGLDIRKKDSETYEKIMTVMYVEKELNSYTNYYDMKKYPEALDSLLKGLERYDLYIDRASELGIENDLNYVKKQIVEKLKNKFKITEEEAIVLNNIEDQTQYSLNVINTALERLN